MSKLHINAFYAGAEVADAAIDVTDYLIVYAEKSSLHISVGQARYRLPSGQVIVINTGGRPLQLHPERDFKGYFLQLDDKVSSGLVHRYLLSMDASQADVRVLAAGKHAKGIRTVFKNIIAELHGQSEASETILNLLLQELLVRLYRASSAAHSEIHSNRMAIVTGICAKFEKEYTRQFTLESIATEYNLSSSYLAHIIKEITGLSLMRYMLFVRVRAAQEYLRQTSLPINEIAEKSGFNDISNFGRTFRNETGCSPRQYRQAHDKDSAEK